MKKIKRVLILLLLLFLIGISIFYSPYRPLLPGYHKLYYTSEKYQRLKENIEKSRVEICKQYKESKTAAVKDEILKKAKFKFVEIVKGNVFPYWYGTFWTFNGHSQIPGESSIACGYFVSTVLKDAGCKINRTRLAQAPSEEMIKKLTGEKWIKRYTNTSMAKIISDLKNDGDQVYIVGLDNHTGFLVCEKGVFSFIHSSGRFPFCVIKEDAETSVVLNKSKYKVVGLLTQDNTFIEKWILGL